MKKYSDINEVWNDLNKGIIVYWSNEGYRLYKEKVRNDSEYQVNHFSNRNGEVLSARFISTYWGSIIEENDIGSLFSKS